MDNKRENKMICPKCQSKLGKVMVSVEGAHSKILSWQCPAKDCIYIRYEDKSASKVISELKNQLTIEQKVIKLSHDRLGIYFGKDIARCVGLKGGELVHVTVPDKKHIMLRIGP